MPSTTTKRRTTKKTTNNAKITKTGNPTTLSTDNAVFDDTPTAWPTAPLADSMFTQDTVMVDHARLPMQIPTTIQMPEHPIRWEEAKGTCTSTTKPLANRSRCQKRRATTEGVGRRTNAKILKQLKQIIKIIVKEQTLVLQ